MAKFFGSIGYAETAETESGSGCYDTERIVERRYRGDEQRNTRRWEAGESINDNLVINNMISIIADGYASENFSAMRYVRWRGTCWKVTNVEVQRPRLIITIGGVYNGPTL